MKKLFTSLFFAVCTCCCLQPTFAQDFVNLTPKPYQMMKGSGSLSLPTAFAINVAGLPDSVKAEAEQFAANVAKDFTVSLDGDASALLQLAQSEGMEEEAYKLEIGEASIRLEATTVKGFYYGFQTIRKIMTTEKTLPLCTINDKPRFAYRGFMLDVARHFFSVSEVKKMLDLMARYKLNRFHWHLSDDQGWRVEIKKYPKLTTIGATADNCYVTDMKYGPYWTNAQYGPYFYTQEEIKDVVAYAKERHIEIIPEIDMPGHFCAAMTAYPEFSCNPSGAHNVWTSGGISSDVLNVANPEAVQFAKDVITELAALFPYEQINIGGDECPTSAWEGNADCQALYKELGLTSYRQLQSHFIKEMADHIRSLGKKTSVWNEAITASGADVSMIQEAEATVYCWTGAEAAAKKAAQLGLNNIFTPWGPYYINRKQSTDPNEPSAAGDGTDNLAKTYNTVPVPSGTSAELQKYYTGVQGTFWTEHVADTAYLEYLALPRLFAIAEAGWTQQADKNYDDFVKRISADTVYLNEAGYGYCRHDLLAAESSDMVMPKDGAYYRLVTRASDGTRSGRCIELLADGSSLISSYSGNGAAVGKLWTNTQAEEGADNYDYQFWTFEEDPAHPGVYAMVCKAIPDGSVNPTPSANNNTGRWSYDNTTKNYNFILGEAGYGENGSNYYYTVRSDNVSGMYLNASLGGQGLAVNLWANPADGSSGLWTFVAAETGEDDAKYDAFDFLQVDKTYRFTNHIENYEGITISDENTDNYLRHSDGVFANNAWQVVSSTENEDNSQTVTLKNVGTGRSIAAAASSATGKVGYPVGIGSAATNVDLIYSKNNGDFTVSVSGKNVFPVSLSSSALAGVVSCGTVIGGASQAARPQGTGWSIEEVKVFNFTCVDEEENVIGTFCQSVPVDQDTYSLPEIEGYAVKSSAATGTDVKVVYERVSYKVRIEKRDTKNALISDSETVVPVGETIEVVFDEIPYYTFQSATQSGTITPDADLVIVGTYSTTAYSGVKKAGNVISEIVSGNSYLLYDTSPAATERIGYRTVNATDGKILQTAHIEDTDPYSTWTLNKVGLRHTVKNEYTDKYIPTLTQSAFIYVSATAGQFSFTLNADGETWKIQGTNSQYWDGIVGGLTGWHTYGHPYKILEYYVQPYFGVTVRCEDESGKVLSEETNLVKAGDKFDLIAPTFDNLAVSEISGNEALDAVADHTNVLIVYSIIDGINTAEAVGKKNSLIYDLQGRRVNRAQSGIYIAGGKKVLIK